MSADARAVEISNRQACVAALLREHSADGALLLDPANFAWFTAGATPVSAADPIETPGLFLLEQQRWVLCANTDTQRLFDEELDDLGFQVKEWPWHLGRRTLLHGLANGRKLLCDVARADCVDVAESMQRLRRLRSSWDRERLRELGRTVAHALEATCRSCQVGDTEQEIAGHLSHRLMHRGVLPVAIQVVADDRLRCYRRARWTSAKVAHYCVLRVCGFQFGLHVTASRSVCFGSPDDALRQDYELACRQAAVQVVHSVPGSTVAAACGAGQRLLAAEGRDHEWRQAPIGWATGPAPVELALVPDATEIMQSGWALVWAANVGSAMVTDTFVITDTGPECVTAAELWPIKRYKIGAHLSDHPDLLIRQ